MRHIVIILTFPYFMPTAIALCFEHLWAFATNKMVRPATMSGGEVPDYFIILPLALALQILVGIPGSLIIRKASLRGTAIVFAALLAILPIAFITTSSQVNGLSLASLLPLLEIFALFGVGSCITFYCLRCQRTKNSEQSAS